MRVDYFLRTTFGLTSLAAALLVGCGGSSGGTGCGENCHTPPPNIVLSHIGPYNVALSGQNWVVAGVPSFTLVATGTGFPTTAVVEWNGAELSTQFGSSTDLAATVPASLVAAPGTASITVYDPASGVASSALPLGIASTAAANAGVVQLITAAPDGSPGNLSSSVAPSISATGRYVSFQSSATNLGAGPSTAFAQIYERDTCIGAPPSCTPSTIPISVTYDGSPVNDNSFNSSVSGDGRFVAFDSKAWNILDFPGAEQICSGSLVCVYLRDTCIGAGSGCKPQTVIVSTTTGGEYEDGGNDVISPDGRYVTFNSTGTSAGQNNVFLRDTCVTAPPGCVPTTAIASVSSDGAAGNSASFSQTVNSGGRFVAFQSYATNLIPDDTNIYPDIFLRDTCNGAPTGCTPSTTRVDVGPNGEQTNQTPDYEVVPSISNDGRLVAYASDATNLVTQDVNGLANIYARDTCFGAPAGCTPTTSLVSLANDGSIANSGQNNQSMSADGRYIAFASLASNLVPGDTFAAGSWQDIFVRDTCFGAPNGCTPSTVRVSVTNLPQFATQANAISDFPRISGDGHYVVFISAATNFLSTPGNGQYMVYLAKTGF